MNDNKLQKFLDSIEREWNWRQGELTSLKQVLARVDFYQKKVISRSSVLLLYAHWEGFIKEISQKFLMHFRHEDIGCVPKYVIAAHLARMNYTFSQENNKIDTAHQCLDSISNGAKISAQIHEVINTESNLNSNNLKKIAKSVGVDFTQFELRVQFIDRSFIAVRHGIAHGEGRPVTEEEFFKLEKSVTSLMDIFKNNIIDSAKNANLFLNKAEQHTCLKFIE